MSTRTVPYYELPVEGLARWVERQGDQWWSVDGDPELMGRLSLPCPGARLAGELRKIGRPLFVSGSTGAPPPRGGAVDSTTLDRFVSRLGESIHVINGQFKPAWANDRVLTLRWNTGGDWLLSEDSEEAAAVRRDAAAAGAA